MKKLFYTILNIILPPRCLICGKIVNNDYTLCNDCFYNINFITAPICKSCGLPLNYKLDTNEYCANCIQEDNILKIVRSAVYYDEASKPLILDFKFFDHLENKKLLSNWLYIASSDIFNDHIDLIIPVPLHYLRLFKRKYNQSAILANELSKKVNISADFKSLKKKRHTRPQVECNGKTRKKNVHNAFEISKPENIKNKHILLIDDVYTTGSTLNECAKVLIKAGATSVSALTVARVC